MTDVSASPLVKIERAVQAGAKDRNLDVAGGDGIAPGRRPRPVVGDLLAERRRRRVSINALRIGSAFVQATARCGGDLVEAERRRVDQ